MTVRYCLLQNDIKRLAKAKPLLAESVDTFPVRFDPKNPIFVDILEVDGDWAKLRLFYADGEVVNGWTWHFETMCPVGLHNARTLFDGRFNSDA